MSDWAQVAERERDKFKFEIDGTLSSALFNYLNRSLHS